MEIIKTEFRGFLLEDKIPSLDKAKNYQVFYFAYNLEAILNKFHLIQQ